MEYIKINNPSDLQINNPITNWHFINEELFTINEWNKMDLLNSYWVFDPIEGRNKKVELNSIIEKIEVSKFDTYFFFGARFNLNK